MLKNIHPKYEKIVFLDTTSGFELLTRSTISSKEKITLKDGNTYPLIKVSVSSDSHPFYNKGKKIFKEARGRVERYNKRYTK